MKIVGGLATYWSSVMAIKVYPLLIIGQVITKLQGLRRDLPCPNLRHADLLPHPLSVCGGKSAQDPFYCRDFGTLAWLW